MFELLVMMTGRFVICIATLGCCKCEPPFSVDHRTRSAAGSLWYSHAGRCVVTQTGQSLAGFLFYVALVLAVVLVAQSVG
ncbi:hypothetical protein LJR118_003230 [Acidovorax sp. LjRoot118]|uniref:hypothetical protein n=1 Tax=Acidovorax sp. LjRoot118 TaxID=3342256 RepID=UPI003ED0C688